MRALPTGPCPYDSTGIIPKSTSTTCTSQDESILGLHLSPARKCFVGYEKLFYIMIDLSKYIIVLPRTTPLELVLDSHRPDHPRIPKPAAATAGGPAFHDTRNGQVGMLRGGTRGNGNCSTLLWAYGFGRIFYAVKRSIRAPAAFSIRAPRPRRASYHIAAPRPPRFCGRSDGGEPPRDTCLESSTYLLNFHFGCMYQELFSQWTHAQILCYLVFGGQMSRPGKRH